MNVFKSNASDENIIILAAYVFHYERKVKAILEIMF